MADLSLGIEASGSTNAPHGAAVAVVQRSSAGFGRIVLIAGLFTASYDLFLVLNIGGFTLRIHQVLLAVSTLAALQLSFSAEKLRAPVGAFWIIVWTLFIFAFVPHTTYLARNIGYALWLVLDVLIIFVTVQLFGNKRWIELLLRGYLWAFLSTGAIGVLEIVLGVARVPEPWIKQWVIAGVLPRVSGFSYEPSYYSTYMLLGWVFAAWLVEHQAYDLGRRLTRGAFFVSSLAMVLSTSRMGLAMMSIWGLGYFFRRLRQRGPLKISPVLIIAGVVVVVVAAVWLARGDHLKTAFAKFAAGTGLGGTAAHSVNDRERSLLNTLIIIKKSPFIGYSLGGVATAIGVSHGLKVADNADAKQNEGGMVFAEVLAASGVIGFIPFILYIVALIRRPLLLSHAAGNATGTILSGLVLALCMELLILQFNQNILRAYLWFHLAVLSATYAAVSKDRWRAAGASMDTRQ